MKDDQSENIFQLTSNFIEVMIAEHGAGSLSVVADILKSRIREEFERDMKLDRKSGARI